MKKKKKNMIMKQTKYMTDRKAMIYKDKNETKKDTNWKSWHNNTFSSGIYNNNTIKRQWITKKPALRLVDISNTDWVAGKITLSADVIGAIRTLCRDIRMEWQMFLIGNYVDGGVCINAYHIPEQKVTGASVESLEPITKEIAEEKGIVAIIHSHGNMSVFFSPEDNKTIASTRIPYHIVVNNKEDFIAIKTIYSDSKTVVAAKAQVYIETNYIEVEGIDKIKERNCSGIGVSAVIEDEYTDYGEYSRKDTPEFRNTMAEYEKQNTGVKEMVETVRSVYDKEALTDNAFNILHRNKRKHAIDCTYPATDPSALDKYAGYLGGY